VSKGRFVPQAKEGVNVYKVVKDFINKGDGKVYRRGGTIEAAQERADVLLGKGFIAHIEEGPGPVDETDAGI
jgi:hypothetical protein